MVLAGLEFALEGFCDINAGEMSPNAYLPQTGNLTVQLGEPVGFTVGSLLARAELTQGQLPSLELTPYPIMGHSLKPGVPCRQLNML